MFNHKEFQAYKLSRYELARPAICCKSVGAGQDSAKELRKECICSPHSSNSGESGEGTIFIPETEGEAGGGGGGGDKKKKKKKIFNIRVSIFQYSF